MKYYLLSLLLFSGMLMAAGGPAVRDARDGAYLEANARIFGRDIRQQTIRVGGLGKKAWGLKPGLHKMRFERVGYQPLETQLEMGPDALPVTIWLDPLPDEGKRALTGDTHLPEDVGLIRGYLYDESRRPMAGVSVYLEAAGYTAVPTPPPPAPVTKSTTARPTSKPSTRAPTLISSCPWASSNSPPVTPLSV